MGNFEGAKVKHIQGQEAKVNEQGNREIEDQDKAYEMAKTEDFYHAQAERFEEYLKDPEAFSRIREDEKVADINGYYRAEYFERFAQEGITPEDLRTIGDRVAEVRGSAVDYEKTVHEKSTARLKLEAVVFGLVNLKQGVLGLAADAKNSSNPGTGTEQKVNRDNQKIETWLKKEIAERELRARGVEANYGPEAAGKTRQREIPTLRETF